MEKSLEKEIKRLGCSELGPNVIRWGKFRGTCFTQICCFLCWSKTVAEGSICFFILNMRVPAWEGTLVFFCCYSYSTLVHWVLSPYIFKPMGCWWWTIWIVFQTFGLRSYLRSEFCLTTLHLAIALVGQSAQYGEPTVWQQKGADVLFSGWVGWGWMIGWLKIMKSERKQINSMFHGY